LQQAGTTGKPSKARFGLRTKGYGLPVLLSAAAASLMTLPSLQSDKLKPDFKAEFNEGGGGSVQVRLVISPAGIAIHCDRAWLNGPVKNVDAFCDMLRSRTRFQPARDEAGQPAYGVIYVWSHWNQRRWAGSYVPQWDPVDLALPVNKLPKGFPEGSIFELTVHANEKGMIAGDCTVAAGQQPSEVAALLCREAAAEPVMPATNERGEAVPSVQQFYVRLTSKALIDDVIKRLKAR
jgi:hypothetical protein